MKYFFLFYLSLLLFSCAEIIPPTGGEKDTEAPKIVSVYPQNGALLFVENKIEIKFDEFIKIKTSGDNIFISPPLKEKPKYQLFGKKLFITFQEELLENTTYNINFGETIEDYNESNKLENFNYFFSTGTFLDSLQVSGQTLDAFNKKPVENILVMLYPESEDSVLFKKPLYIAKTDKSGEYTLKNIKAGKYKIAALEDKNQNLIFDQSTEKISFVSEVLEINQNIKAEPFFLFESIEKISILNKDNNTENHIVFEFNKSFSNIGIDISNYNEKDILYYSKDKKNLHYWYLNKESESSFYFNINSSVKDTFKTRLKNDTSSLPFDIEITTDIQTEKKIFELSFPFPISSFNQNLLNIQDKTLNNIAYTSAWDEHNLNLTLTLNKLVDSASLNIKNACFISFHNKTNASINKVFSGFSVNSTNLILNIPYTEDNIILQLINSKEEIIEEQNVSRETKILFNNIKTGKYFIRVFEDKNENSLWDSGLFHVKQYPEYTLLYSKEIELKANWDKEIELKF